MTNYTFDVDNGLLITNESDPDVTIYLAIALLFLILFLGLCSWTHRLILISPRRSRLGVARCFRAGARLRSRILDRSVPGLPSVGHLFAILVYIGVNVVLMFTNVTGSSRILASNYARRSGWLATANLVLVFLLSLKTTPLVLLNLPSYEQLNIFHQAAGYTTIVEALVHSVLFVQNRLSEKLGYNLTANLQIYGMLSVLCLMLILFSALFLRKRRYELFYVLHVGLSVLAIGTLNGHRPHFTTKTMLFILICGGLYAVDKILRIGKYTYHRFVGKTAAVLRPLPNGATHVVLTHSLPTTPAGLHARLWIPRICTLQTHPMTVVSTSPVTFVISAKTGFTTALHKYAVAEPGATVTAMFAGPYGSLPPFGRYDVTILIAGGSGATWTFAVCMDLLDRHPQTRVEFVWVVRNTDTLGWFEAEIQALKTTSQVNLSLYVTNAAHEHADPDSAARRQSRKSRQWPSPTWEDVPMTELPRPHSGRPLLREVVRNAVVGLKREDRAMVGVCGPASMARDVSDAVRVCNGTRNGPLVDMHKEVFGW